MIVLGSCQGGRWWLQAGDQGQGGGSVAEQRHELARVEPTLWLSLCVCGGVNVWGKALAKSLNNR